MIRPKMEQLLIEYHENTEDIITKLAKFHIEFESIHPNICSVYNNTKMVIS